MRAAVLFILLCALGRTAALADDRSFDAIQPHEQTDSASAHLAYAEFLASNGKLRAAIVQWQTAQAIDPANAAIANSLGGAYLRMGRAAESADQFARAVGIESNNAAYHYNLANVEFMLRRDLTVAWHMEPAELLRHALAEFRDASRLSPNDLEYARAYAETFYGLPDPDWSEAEVAWKHVLELSPQRDFAYLQLARVSLKRGDKAQA